MLPFLEGIDVAVLTWIYRAWSWAPADLFFKWITDSSHFLIPLALAWLLLLIFGRGPGRWLALMLAFCLLLTDQVSSQMIKPWVDRTRPCFALEVISARISQVDSPSFPSSHAANLFGAIWLLVLVRGKRWLWGLLVATAVGLSRIYLGVHYPSDVIAGALLGLACAWLIRQVLSLVRLAGTRCLERRRAGF